MILTVAQVMWLALWRDRGSLILAFLLPPLMFFVFAEVFSGTGENELEMRVVILDSVESPVTGRLRAEMIALDGLVVSDQTALDVQALEAQVRSGRHDAAVWIRAEPDGDLDAEAAIVVVGDASRALATSVVVGRLQAMLQSSFPEFGIARAATLVDALAGPYSDDQRQALDEVLDGLARDQAGLGGAGAMNDVRDDASDNNQGAAGGLIERRLLAGPDRGDDGISYYAGAVAILFLLFSAMQGAISLIDERTSGIVDRLVAGPGGYTTVVLGKGLFLTGQGLAQAGVIFAFAWWFYDIDWPGHFGAWLVTALLAAAVSAWLGLLLASLCRSRQQAQTASAFVVLILSAIGGSMMPRFLMPGWLRELGWFTPNAWVIESWQGIFWRGDGVPELATGWVVLAAIFLTAMGLTLWRAAGLTRIK
ncbi:MAG: ABC transporter permease [Wenzhouxiangellaceae bacterium]|nr:ABC transporter permease [Wenzhouxiangellaceae bacterium]